MLRAGQLMGFWSASSDPTVAPSYDSAGTTGVATATPVAPSYPATVASGDMLILIVGITSSATDPSSITTPAGWTLIPNTSLATTPGADLLAGAAYYKVADGTETGTFNVTLSMSGANVVAIARVFRFLNASGVESGGTTTWSSALIDACLGNYGNWESVSVPITGAKRMIVQAVVMDNDFSAGISPPSGFASSVNATTTSGGDAGLALTYKTSDTNYTGGGHEVISSGGVIGQDSGVGFTIGFALIGV